MNLPGVHFEAGQTAPHSIPGVANNPSFDGQEIATVQISVTDAHTYRPLTGGLEVLKVIMDLAPADEREDLVNKRWMGLLSGSERLNDGLASGLTINEMAASWAAEVDVFRGQAAPYLLYD
jgi:uncharacterized protein YbbC (DUF1343 family)